MHSSVGCPYSRAAATRLRRGAHGASAMAGSKLSTSAQARGSAPPATSRRPEERRPSKQLLPPRNRGARAGRGAPPGGASPRKLGGKSRTVHTLHSNNALLLTNTGAAHSVPWPPCLLPVLAADRNVRHAPGKSERHVDLRDKLTLLHHFQWHFLLMRFVTFGTSRQPTDESANDGTA